MTYTYGCRVCGNEFEVEQSINDEAIAECPECHVGTGNRLIVAGNFILKGDGWAKDRYSKNNK
jgi:putative FmdB family regulatory protein